jgi:YD repeat-containing protein
MVLIAVAAGLVLSAATFWGLRQRARRSLAHKLEIAIDRHFATLASGRAEALRYDAEGRLQSPEWQQEIERFLDSQFSSLLSPGELKRLERQRPRLAALVAERVAAGLAGLPAYQ